MRAASSGFVGEPTVSVIIPIWNAQDFLAEAVDSVLAQSYTNWELILVDDCSTDASAQIARKYCGEHAAKIRCVTATGERNRGASWARNTGIRYARGRHVALLDADDVWLPKKLEQQVAILERHPEVDVLFGRSLYWHTAPRESAKDHLSDYGLELNTVIAPPRLLAHYLRGKGTTPCPSCMLLRREVLDRIGGFEKAFCPPYGMYEDQAFLVKVFSACVVYVAEECWQKYRIHQQSICALTRHAGNEDVARAFYLRWLQRYLAENDFIEAGVSRLVARALWKYEHRVLYRMLVPFLTASRAGRRAFRKSISSMKMHGLT